MDPRCSPWLCAAIRADAPGEPMYPHAVVRRTDKVGGLVVTPTELLSPVLASVHRPKGPGQNRCEADPDYQGYGRSCRDRVDLVRLSDIGSCGGYQSPSGKRTRRQTLALEKQSAPGTDGHDVESEQSKCSLPRTAVGRVGKPPARKGKRAFECGPGDGKNPTGWLEKWLPQTGVPSQNSGVVRRWTARKTHRERDGERTQCKQPPGVRMRPNSCRTTVRFVFHGYPRFVESASTSRHFAMGSLVRHKLDRRRTGMVPSQGELRL